jgi:hypothetical protein
MGSEQRFSGVVSASNRLYHRQVIVTTYMFWNRHHKFAAVAALWLSDGVARLWLSTSERVTQVRQCYGYPFLDTLFTWILEHMNHAWAVPDPA